MTPTMTVMMMVRDVLRSLLLHLFCSICWHEGLADGSVAITTHHPTTGTKS